jgi:hypothetical protein
MAQMFPMHFANAEFMLERYTKQKRGVATRPLKTASMGCEMLGFNQKPQNDTMISVAGMSQLAGAIDVGNVACWHEPDLTVKPSDVGYRGVDRTCRTGGSRSEFDPRRTPEAAFVGHPLKAAHLVGSGARQESVAATTRRAKHLFRHSEIPRNVQLF